MSGQAETTLNSGAVKQPRGRRLPQRLASLISPEAEKQRKESVRARLEDQSQERVFRRRSAEVIANHLLAVVDDA